MSETHPAVGLTRLGGRFFRKMSIFLFIAGVLTLPLAGLGIFFIIGGAGVWLYGRFLTKNAEKAEGVFNRAKQGVADVYHGRIE